MGKKILLVIGAHSADFVWRAAGTIALVTLQGVGGGDPYAKQAGMPLSAALGGTRTRVAAGVSIGIQDSLEQLTDRVAAELADGYQRVKIKVKPGWDLAAAAAVRRRFGHVPLMVDANAAYRLEDAEHLARLDEFGLMMIEHPLDYDDIADHAALQRRLATPICLDESIHSVTPRPGCD